MKAIFTKLKHKNNNKKRAADRLKRSLEFKKSRKSKNRKDEYQTKAERKDIRNIKKLERGVTSVSTPREFSFIKYPNEATKFINKLEKLYLKNKSTFIDLSKVESLDHSAITVLASIARTYKIRGVKFNGRLPKNQQLKQLFIDSDFFKYLTDQPIDKIKYILGKDNQMFTTKDAKVAPELGIPVMQDASEVVWGEKRTCKGLQRVLLELMQNSNNHAKLKDRGVNHWWLSVNHNKDKNTVSFIFVDYGIGIFKSLNSERTGKWYGWKEKIADSLQKDKDILKKLMDGHLHRTVTGKPFRGKGLPGIKQVFDRDQISNLYVISNKVFANVSQDKYNNLPDSFNGTFVYWELNQKNGSSEWIE